MAPGPILVVDDEALIAGLLELALSEGGYDVVAAQTAAEALDALEGIKISALISDIALGKDQPTGWHLARRARQLNPEVPVVYVTGDSSWNWAAEGVPKSVLVPKPFHTGQVMEAVEGLLNRREDQPR